MVTVKNLTLRMVVAALLSSGIHGQQLNGHINPLWLSSGRGFPFQTSSAASFPSGLQGSSAAFPSGLQTSYPQVPSRLQLYYLDSSGTFRPISSAESSSIGPTRQPLSYYRTSEPDFNGNSRSGYYNRQEAPSYMTRIN